MADNFMPPSQQIIAAAMASETVQDSSGRALELRKTTTREVRRFVRACGAAADIDRWFGEAVVALQVRSIDGVPVLFPQTADQADALVEKLDNTGLEAVVEWLRDKRETDAGISAKN